MKCVLALVEKLTYYIRLKNLCHHIILKMKKKTNIANNHNKNKLKRVTIIKVMIN